MPIWSALCVHNATVVPPKRGPEQTISITCIATQFCRAAPVGDAIRVGSTCEKGVNFEVQGNDEVARFCGAPRDGGGVAVCDDCGYLA